MAVHTRPDLRRPKPRPSRGARRVGYFVAVGVNAAMLFAVNTWPGWDVLPFLTGETEQVIGWVNASIVVSLVANLVYLLDDRRWLRALGDIVTTGVGIVAMVRLWQVFPFDFDAGTLDWALVARILLAVGIIGSVIGVLVALVALVRELGPGARSVRPVTR